MFYVYEIIAGRKRRLMLDASKLVDAQVLFEEMTSERGRVRKFMVTDHDGMIILVSDYQ